MLGQGLRIRVVGFQIHDVRISARAKQALEERLGLAWLWEKKMLLDLVEDLKEEEEEESSS